VYDERGVSSIVAASNMVHVPGLGFDGIKGLSVISAVARQSVGLALTMDKSVARSHANGVKPSGAIEADAGLSPEAFTRLKASFGQLYSGADNSGNVVFLDKGMKFNPISITPVDAQTLESRRYQVADIARIFGVPPHMIGETDKTTSWGSGIEQMSMGFVRYSLRPWLVRIEQELNRKLVTGKNYFCEFSLEGLLRGDSKARGDFYASGIQNGWMKPNEARRLENLPPVDAGDRLYANGTIQPLEGAGDDQE
jgi:HK97 family phage portal protein